MTKKREMMIETERMTWKTPENSETHKLDIRAVQKEQGHAKI